VRASKYHGPVVTFSGSSADRKAACMILSSELIVVAFELVAVAFATLSIFLVMLNISSDELLKVEK